MKQTNPAITSKNVKKGITAIVVGIMIVVAATSLTSHSGVVMAIGLILDIFGVLLGLSGFGYLVGLLGRKK